MDRVWLKTFALRVLAVFVLLSVATVIAGLAIRAWAPAFDLQAIQAVAAHRTAGLTRLTSVLTALGSLVIVSPLAAIAVVVLWRWGRRSDALVLLIVVVGSALLATITKLLVARPRPPVEHLTQVSSHSFPSEHAVQAAAIYLAMAVVLSRTWPTMRRRVLVGIAVVIALVVAGSRVYLGVHYPTDVAAGLIAGWIWGWLLVGQAQKDENRVMKSTGTS
jgi:undecaprenyl-diphosphatase